jgi:DNA-binding response OmpR family regulator
MTDQPVRLAVVDRDSGFLKVLGNRLDQHGWEYRFAGAAIPVESLRSMRLTAVVVDLAHLGPSAWAWLQDVSAELHGVGLVVCTGRSTVGQRVRGLRLGADDWVTKPCHPEEVIARVEAVSRRRRRSDPQARADRLEVGELAIDRGQFQAFADGRTVDLTRREFELIEMLASAEGQVLQRDHIYREIWGYAMARGDRSVDVFVRRVRQKLEQASPGWRYIHTQFGVGYRFAAERDADEATDADLAQRVMVNS